MFKGKGDTSQLGGPIKIAKITGQVAQLGFIAFLSIMAYISISLGFINLLPIPLLDGGHLMFYSFEKILGRPLSQKAQEGLERVVDALSAKVWQLVGDEQFSKARELMRISVAEYGSHSRVKSLSVAIDEVIAEKESS